MKIVSISFLFNKDMSYQENYLIRQNLLDGHSVVEISDTYTFVDGKITFTPPEDNLLEDGLRLIRLRYKNFFNQFVANKMKSLIGLYETLEETNPDLIIIHDLCGFYVNDLIRYKRNHDSVRLIGVLHCSLVNSGQNFFSLNILHKKIYKRLVNKIFPYLEKTFCIGIDELDMAVSVYGLPKNQLEFLTLGGCILSDSEYETRREKYRKIVNLQGDKLLILVSGKMSKKKRVIELLRAFKKSTLDCKLIIIGKFEEDINSDALQLISEDSRIEFLGWKNANDLQGFMCAADLYCQPGTVSASVQNAICCYCPIMCNTIPTYQEIDKGNFIWANTEEEFKHVFDDMCSGKIDLNVLTERSKECAKEVLDYSVLVKKFY